MMKRWKLPQYIFSYFLSIDFLKLIINYYQNLNINIITLSTQESFNSILVVMFAISIILLLPLGYNYLYSYYRDAFYKKEKKILNKFSKNIFHYKINTYLYIQ